MNDTEVHMIIAPPEEPWLTPKEAAIALDLVVASVYTMIHRKQLRVRIKPGPALERPRFLIDPACIRELKARVPA